jgi:AmmeMemoRadiSam system protein B
MITDWIGWFPCLSLSLAIPLLAWMGARGGGPRAVGPAVAGTWYPGDGPSLARAVDGYLEAAEPQAQAGGRVIGLIEPHAGYVYSGAVAGRGFRAVRGCRYARVIVIGPSHYEGFRGAALPDAEVYRTPLGDVPLDRKAIETLARNPRFTIASRPFHPEHSLEAEIPFLQRALEPGWRLLPVLVGAGTSGTVAQEVADALRAIAEPATLVVVSSDFTHYGPRFGYVPFKEDVPNRLRTLDMGAVRLAEALDADGLETYVRETGATICGRDAIGVLLRLLPRGTTGSLAAYDTSGNLTGDWHHSVSYAALTFREGP